MFIYIYTYYAFPQSRRQEWEQHACTVGA
jgi:hypothetical protein